MLAPAAAAAHHRRRTTAAVLTEGKECAASGLRGFTGVALRAGKHESGKRVGV